MSDVPEILHRIQSDLQGVPEYVQDLINRNNKLETELQSHKERESEIQEREEKVVKKEKTLKNKQKAQNKRDKTLKEREMSLLERERSLNERAKTLKQAEKELEVREKALTDQVNPNGIQINQAVAKGFQDLPPEIIGKIMSYCSTADQKEMRCVSKWCFIVVSTASKELKSIFCTYTIKNVHERNYPQISEVLSNAVKRSYGPEVMLDLQLDSFHYSVSPGQIKGILTSNKENLVSLGIKLNPDDPEILLQPHLEFKNIKRLDISFQQISFHCVDEGLHKNICEAILARYGDKLEHLAVWDLKIPNNSVLQVPHLSQLKSLALVNIYVKHDIVNTFVNSVNKENITHLSLSFLTLDIEQLDNFIFPKLQNLKLVGSEISGESVLALIKYNKDTITKLIVIGVHFTHSDIGDIKIPNLQYLDLFNISGDVALSLIKCNKDAITMLKLDHVNFGNSDIGDIKIPNLQYLELLRTPGDVALSLIKCNKDTITKLIVSSVHFTHSDIEDIKIPNLQYLELLSIPSFALSLIKNNNDTLCEIRLNIPDFGNTYLPVVEMPRLKHLYLMYIFIGGTLAELEYEYIKFIKAFGGNIEELWYYDFENKSYVRKSREELNNLKTEALALQ